MDLEPHRREIDACDTLIVEALNRRARAAMEIGRIKREQGRAVFAPERERAVYDKIQALNTGPLSERHLHNIYREIMSGCIALEAPTRVAYLGPPGTFTHQAALEKFGAAMEYLPQPEIRDVFLAVNREHADYGVAPIENSTEGAVTATADMLMETELRICNEIFLPIHQNLLSMCELREIELVVSHPVALAQCRTWLAANLPGVPTEPVPSTALAAEQASYKKGVAAIAGAAAASMYDFSHIEECVEDNPNNMTRFIVLAHGCGGVSGDDRTSIFFSIRHASGSLHLVLEPFDRNGINLTRIESRPSKKVNWEYSFFVDLEGHAEEERVAATLAEVQGMTDDFRILGSYPRARHIVATPPPLEG